MKKMSGKGQMGLNNLGTVALSVGIFIIIVGVVASILTQVQATQITGTTGCTTTNQTMCGVAFNTSQDGLVAMGLFGDWASIVVIVAIASIVITIIVLAFRVVG